MDEVPTLRTSDNRALAGSIDMKEQPASGKPGFPLHPGHDEKAGKCTRCRFIGQVTRRAFFGTYVSSSRSISFPFETAASDRYDDLNDLFIA
jgi:hypothetical protein